MLANYVSSSPRHVHDAVMLSVMLCLLPRAFLGLLETRKFKVLKTLEPMPRAVCERRALRCARELLVNPEHFAAMQVVTAHADSLRADGAQPYHVLQPIA